MPAIVRVLQIRAVWTFGLIPRLWDIEPPRSKRCDARHISQIGVTLKQCSEAHRPGRCLSACPAVAAVNCQHAVSNADSCFL